MTWTAGFSHPSQQLGCCLAVSFSASNRTVMASLVARSCTVSTVLSTKSRRGSVKVSAAQKTKLDDRGYVTKDNSGRGNIFPTAQKAFYKSATSERVANQGLGGAQGGAVLLAAMGLVGLATAGVLGLGSGETLATVQGSGNLDSLSAIAQRLAASI